jgi:hypothetical protein
MIGDTCTKRSRIRTPDGKYYCEHEKAPYVFAMGRADPLMCEDLIEKGQCPELPPKRDRYAAVRV